MSETIIPTDKQLELIRADETLVFYAGEGSEAFFTDVLSHTHEPQYQGVMFKSTHVEAHKLFVQAKYFYRNFMCEVNERRHEIKFPSGAVLMFSYLDRDRDAALNWGGTQLTAIYFVDLLQFSEYQFNFLRTRLGSKCGVKSHMRCSLDIDDIGDHFAGRYINNSIDLETPNYFYYSQGDVCITKSNEDVACGDWTKRPIPYKVVGGV